MSDGFFSVKTKPKKQAVRRKQFADGSAVVTYPDGSLLILESALAQSARLAEGEPVNYIVPAPAPGRKGKTSPLKERFVAKCKW